MRRKTEKRDETVGEGRGASKGNEEGWEEV